MYLILSGLCAGAFAAVCAQAVAPAAPTAPPAEFIPVERDPEIAGKFEEMFALLEQLCRRNDAEDCQIIQRLTTLRGDLYFASLRCAQSLPQACDEYAQHRAGLMATYENFTATAATRNAILSQPTVEEQRVQAQREAQEQRDRDFQRRIDAMEQAQTGFLGMITQ